MGSSKKNKVQETGRWLRVGTLTITTLGPAINLLVTRLRQNRASTTTAHTSERQKRLAYTNTTNTALTEAQEKIQRVGAALTDVLAQLQENPTSQELLKRGEDLTEDLKERWSKLSHIIARQGSKATHVLATRSNDISQELAKRSHAVRQELTEQDRRLWIALGFAVGVSAASVATFLLLRRRFLQHMEGEETPIQLPYNSATNGRTPVNLTRKTTDISKTVGQAATERTGEPSAANGVNHTKVGSGRATTAAPADATLVGVISTRRYYPVDTPLDQLTSSTDQPLDIVYFVDEEEARKQGFSLAE